MRPKREWRGWERAVWLVTATLVLVLLVLVAANTGD
jgi:hypothetical protein